MNPQLRPLEKLALKPAGWLYYGWVMVVVAAVAMVATLPGRTHGLGLITERLLSDTRLGLTRESYAHVNLTATLLGALFCVGFGGLLDRVGVRRVLTLVLLLLGLTVVGMSRVEGVLPFLVAVTLTRGFGQSALSVVSISIVGKWFKRRINYAMAAYSVLMSTLFMGAFQMGGSYGKSDWRDYWGTLGLILLVLCPLAWLFARDRPEAMELTMDGLPADSNSDEGPAALTGATLKEAVRTPDFWVFSLAISLFAVISSGISLFNQSILKERGFPQEVYIQSLSIGALVGLVSNFATGWLATKWQLHKLTALALLVLAGTLMFLTMLGTYTQLIVYVCLSAFAGGVITVIFFSVWPVIYGRKHLGRIQGVAQMMTVFASALGPELFAQSKKFTNSYNIAIWGLAYVTLVLACWAWLESLAKKRDTPALHH